VLGFLYKHRGAVASPAVELRRPVTTSLALFRAPAYTLGIAGGLVLLTVTADRLFAHRVSRREWIGVGLAALGLAFLAATLEGTGDNAQADYVTAHLIVYIVVVGVAAVAVAVASIGNPREGVMLGVSAGLFWAASDTSIKALSGQLGDSSAVAILLSPLAVVIALGSAVGLVVSARSLQLGEAVPVIALTSVAANALTIAAGPLVFSEPFPDTAAGIALRLAAFALVIVAAALTPAPVSAAERLDHSDHEATPATGAARTTTH
jgi:hypothetical protein